MFGKSAAHATGGEADNGMDDTASGLDETSDEQEELHDGGLDLYDIDSEY